MSETDSIQRIRVALTDTVRNLLMVQSPDHGEECFHDAMMSQDAFIPKKAKRKVERALALPDVMLNEQEHADPRLVRTALRLLEILTQLLVDIPSALHSKAAQEIAQLLQALGSAPEVDHACR
eukprot:EG_transcript_49969